VGEKGFFGSPRIHKKTGGLVLGVNSHTIYCGNPKEAYMAEAVKAEAEEAAREAAEYDAWFRRKVQEALDETEVFTAEEVEAEAAKWRAKVRRRMVSETGLEAHCES
jgi:hypothetical protein